MNVSIAQKAREGRIAALAGMNTRKLDNDRAQPLLLKPADIPHVDSVVFEEAPLFKSIRKVDAEPVLVAA